MMGEEREWGRVEAREGKGSREDGDSDSDIYLPFNEYTEMDIQNRGCWPLYNSIKYYNYILRCI